MAIVLIFSVNFVHQCLLLKWFLHPWFIFRLLNYSCYFYISLLNLMEGGSKFSMVKLRTNGLNKSQHYWANNVGSCWVRVDSGVQTHATTPNNGGTYSASWEGQIPSKDLRDHKCNPNNVGRAVQTNPTLLRFPLVIKEHVGVQIWRESSFLVLLSSKIFQAKLGLQSGCIHTKQLS